MPASVELSTEQRILEASAVLPAHGGVTGWAALRWRRARWSAGIGAGQLERPVMLVTAGDDIRPQPGIAVSAERLDPCDLVGVDGVRLTSSVRSTWFEMRYAVDIRAAVRVLDMAAYDDLVSIDELAEFSWLHPGWTGAPRCRGALGLADENAWSPMEVDTRLVYVIDAQLPRPLTNRPIFDRQGRHIGTPDLLDAEAGLVIEYDGSQHLRAVQRARDVRREEAYRRHGLEYLTVLASDLANPFEPGRAHASCATSQPVRSGRPSTLDDRAASVVDAHAFCRASACLV